MAESSGARAKPLHRGLPDEIVLWEILVRLPPKSLLRCRAVCRAWRCATSARDFLLAHHTRQPSLPFFPGSQCRGRRYQEIHAFDHRAAADAQLQPVARLDDSFNLEASCDGLAILSKYGVGGTCLSVCNLATREYAPIGPRPPWDFYFFSVLGMYLHRPTGEYRLLLHRTNENGSVVGHPNGKIGCYVFVLGSDQPPRYIGRPEPDAATTLYLYQPALLRDSLHWYPTQHQGEDILSLVFDTTAESFRKMRAPVIPRYANIFEMDNTLGIYSYDSTMETADIWVLQNYEDEVWDCKYRVELPVAEIEGQCGLRDGDWDVTVVSGHGAVLVMVSCGPWLFYVDTDGEMVANFHRDGQDFFDHGLRLKQTLVRHTIFTALEGYAVNAFPFV